MGKNREPDPPPGQGLFVVLEGPDGVGKSTQVARIGASLESAGQSVLITREPGGTALGEALREVLISSNRTHPMAELFILQAARVQHYTEVIGPALGRGETVICDRYVGSSIAYQGIAKGLGVNVVMESFALATVLRLPDLTICLDAEAPHPTFVFSSHDMFEKEGMVLWQRVRTAYREAAAAFGWRIEDATADPGEVTARVLALIAELRGR